MGVYIPKMEMPKNCGECPCYYYEYKECNANGGRMVFRNATPPTDCPLIELPPHGDLIDHNALKLAVLEETYNTEDGVLIVMKKIFDKINNAPIVVESEE